MRDIQLAVKERARAKQKLKRLGLPAAVGEEWGGWIGKARDKGWVEEIVCGGKGYDDLVSTSMEDRGSEVEVDEDD